LRAAANSGEKSVSQIIKLASEIIGASPLARIDYVEVVDIETFRPIETVGPNSLLALAVFFGKTRLIDNMRLG
jgi:pantoate--beta-alanine ligase